MVNDDGQRVIEYTNSAEDKKVVPAKPGREEVLAATSW